MRFHRMRSLAWLPALLVIGSACSRGPSQEVQAQLEDLAAAAQERDQLVEEVAENSRILSEISMELAKVQVPARELAAVSTESPLGASRDTVMRRIRYITRRVGEVEGRLRESRNRIDELTNISDSLRTTLQETVKNFEGIVEAQLSTINTMRDQIVALNDTLTRVAAQANRVYYVIGTKDELKQKGIVVEEGGSRFLFVLWRQGETLQPARELDPAQFTAIDRRQVHEIPLPDPTASYRIASRQDLEFLETRPADKGKITSTPSIRIADSEQFWLASKFLIIVREGGNGGGNPAMATQS